MRERRLRDVDALGSPREAEAVGQRHEVAKMPQLHRNPMVESMASILSMGIGSFVRRPPPSIAPLAQERDGGPWVSPASGGSQAGDDTMLTTSREKLWTQDALDAFAKTPGSAAAS